MDIQQVFPFYDIAPIINREIDDNFNLLNPKYMKTQAVPQVILSAELINQIWTYYQIRIELIHIMPNDVYIFAGTDELLKILMNFSYAENKYIPVLITNIDYSKVANNLSLRQNVVERKLANGYDKRRCSSVNFVTDAMFGRRSVVKGGKFLNEEKLIDFDSDVPEYKSALFLDEIESYLRSTDITEQVPILIGLSGIAKSALVKSITEKLDKDETYLKENPYGVRLSDFRVSFMSSLDINGMFFRDGVNVKLSPTFEFFSCTDEFLSFSRSMVELIENKLKDSEVEQKNKLILLDVLDTFKYYSKTPVFFFDEITRCSSDIQGALSIILNQRLYQQYHLREARIIAATNMPYLNKVYKNDKEQQKFESKLANIFLRTNIKDVAIVDKFIRIKISPEQVLPVWLNWAADNVHSTVISFLQKYPDLAYDVSPITDSDIESLQVHKIIPAYPSYRTWTNVSDYLKHLETISSKQINVNVIKGLLGDKCADRFITFLQKNFKYKIKQSNDTDKLLELIEDTFSANLPIMMVGVPGIGKTSRVRDFCESKGYDPFVISLATLDRTELMGAAIQQNFIEKLTGIVPSEVISSEDIREISAKIKDFPETLTVRSPRYDLRKRIEDSIQTGRILCLIFDEANRSLDSITQSIIFKAISDNEIFGIKFPKDKVRIAVMGNLSGGKTAGARAFDSALYARCVVYTQSDYSVEDSKNLIAYMKSKKFSPVLVDFILKKLPNSKEHVLDWLKSIEEASLLNNVPTARSLKSLSDILNRNPLPSGDMLFGTVLCSDENKRNSFKDSFQNLSEMTFTILDKIDKWVTKQLQ